MYVDNRIEVHADWKFMKQAVDIYLIDREGCSHAQPLVMEKTPEASIIQPCFDLSKKAAQQMMDELWRCGFRPSEGSGSAGSLLATEKHLKDMRAIVFKKLGMEGA